MPPYTRVPPCSAMPFMIAPMACSRTPKWSVRPYGPPDHILVCRSAGRNEAAPLTAVLLLSARSAEPPHSSGSDRVEGGEHLAGGLPGGHALRIGVPGRQGVRPALRQRAGGQPLQQRAALGVAGLPRVEALLPSGVRLPAPVGDLAGVLEHLRVDLEGLVGVEAEDVLGRPDLVLAQRRAVGGAGVLLVRRGPADDRPQHDQRRAAGLGPGGGQRAVDRRQVLAVVDVLHVPAVGLVPRADVLGERDVGVVLDRDPVGVVDQDQVPQLLGAGQRGRLAADTLLEVAVGGERPDGVVEHALALGGVGVQQAALAAGGHRHADGVADALAQRAGRRLHARCVVDLGVARRPGAPGAQRLADRRAPGRSRRGRAGCTG